MSKKPKTEIARCFNCKKIVGEDDYCHGCDHYVCDECDNRGPSGAIGRHKKEAHLGP